VLRQVCRNVKRWRDARMALRWTGTATLEAKKTFDKQLPLLRAALLCHQQALLGDQPIASKNLAALGFNRQRLLHQFPQALGLSTHRWPSIDTQLWAKVLVTA
jgi:hypothetical protein